MTLATDSSTKNLITHSNKCQKKEGPGSSKILTQTTISNLWINLDQTMAVNKIKQEHKTLITLK
jgi:hypothetical protein